MDEALYNNIVATHKACGVHVWACKSCNSSIKALNIRVVEMETKMRKMEENVDTNTTRIDGHDERMDMMKEWKKWKTNWIN